MGANSTSEGTQQRPRSQHAEAAPQAHQEPKATSQTQLGAALDEDAALKHAARIWAQGAIRAAAAKRRPHSSSQQDERDGS